MPPDVRAGVAAALDDPGLVDVALDSVVDPCSAAAGSPLSLREMGLLRGVRQDGGTVTVTLGVTGPGCTMLGVLAAGVQRAVGAVPGVSGVEVRLDAAFTWEPALMDPPARAALESARRPVALRLQPRGPQPPPLPLGDAP